MKKKHHVDKSKIIKPYLAKRRSKLIMVLKAELYNNQDIADVFGLTRFQVRRILHNYEAEEERGGAQ